MFDVQWYGAVWYGLLIQLNETVMAPIFAEPLLAPSRASPLPQGSPKSCGRGLAREGYL
ncbi:hypothetical protein SAMN04490194_5539 [Pseudomonas migulae]|uniref:Uncharacterized protein n=1 Tax=Pseudomonas migulae TaxID=78543 RepID=A0A1H5N597_9PSED|nr:hypothetical protein SAMN04490194_5539 [Pseudomonas migulae]